MRKILVILTLLAHQVAFSQERKEKKSNDGESYELYIQSENAVYYRNAKNKLYKEDIHKNINRKGDQNSYSMGYVTHTKEKTAEMFSMLKKAFDTKKRALPSKNIPARFFFDRQGKTLEIDFIVGSGDQDVDDLSIVEKALIGKFTFKTNSNLLRDNEIYSILYVLRFPEIDQLELKK